MICINCGCKYMKKRKSVYGFFYVCCKCGNMQESESQTKNNQKWFSKRNDYTGK